MIEQLIEMLKQLQNNDELWETMAESYKKMYDALIEAGFTSEEAIKIVAAQGTGIKAG